METSEVPKLLVQMSGAPGSGKTMTLFSALRKLPNMEVVGLNFSSATTPDLLIKTFEQYCEYKKTLNGVLLSPTQIGRWLVIFQSRAFRYKVSGLVFYAAKIR